MKITVLIAAIFLLGLTAGCFIEVAPETKGGSIIHTNISRDSFEIVMYDGCEYIKNRAYSYHFVYTHKGNCKNPIHKTGENNDKKR